MTSFNTSGLFTSRTTELLTITSLIDWLQASENRLLLPPIQRSVVWSNEQVINFWDSLLRGYSPGMMMIHRVRPTEEDASHKGRDEDGRTTEASERDFQLFDGQQRMAAVLLGLGRGQMKDARRLWVDLGAEPGKRAALRFQLRITSSGQPFGYDPSSPNQKMELKRRQDAWGRWLTKHPGDNARQQAFRGVEGRDILGATAAVPLPWVCGLLAKHADRDAVIQELSVQEGASAAIVRDFVTQLDKALQRDVVLQQVDHHVVANQDEYVLFFKRLGQGGTRLTDDELTYSIIKHQYPRIHDRMLEIMGTAGRLADEVDLVLAALRVAKTVAPWPNAPEWEVIGKPTPAFVGSLRDRQGVMDEFLAMIPQDERPAKLAKLLACIRRAVSYDENSQPGGLPNVLLARLPSELVDVLILFASRQGIEEDWPDEISQALCAFALHWLLFVRNDPKAASEAFSHGSKHAWKPTRNSVRKLVGDYEKDGVANSMPRRDALCSLRAEVQGRSHVIPMPAERFTAADCNSGNQPGESLRWLSSNRTAAMRALMWLQRKYITREWPSYDPTSDRDDDLPIDLDHIIPQDIFGFTWWESLRRLTDDVVYDKAGNFRWNRWKIGDSLGNLRWLATSDNRKRGKGAIAPLQDNEDLVPNPEAWNEIIPDSSGEQKWSNDSIRIFQRLIDLRTIALYEKILTESGIEQILLETSAGGPPSGPHMT